MIPSVEQVKKAIQAAIIEYWYIDLDGMMIEYSKGTAMYGTGCDINAVAESIAKDLAAQLTISTVQIAPHTTTQRGPQ